MWTIPEWSGNGYETVLADLHKILQPETYLEIGVAKGNTMILSKCKSIGIDPNPDLQMSATANKPFCCIFNMTSDAFFKSYDPTNIFKSSIELAFLDGLHYFEYLLRDFINVEKHSRKNSVLCLHDCLPCSEHVARRNSEDTTFQSQAREPAQWAGDAWKVLLILRLYRPDLKIHLFDAPPTGLVAITALNPLSNILSDRYYEIVDEFKDASIVDRWGEVMGPTKVLPTNVASSHNEISKLFWL